MVLTSGGDKANYRLCKSDSTGSQSRSSSLFSADKNNQVVLLLYKPYSDSGQRSLPQPQAASAASSASGASSSVTSHCHVTPTRSRRSASVSLTSADLREVLCKNVPGWRHVQPADTESCAAAPGPCADPCPSRFEKESGHGDERDTDHNRKDAQDEVRSSGESSWSETCSLSGMDDSVGANVSTAETSVFDNVSETTDLSPAAKARDNCHDNGANNSQSSVASDEPSTSDNFETLRSLLRRGRRTSTSSQAKPAQRPLSLEHHSSPHSTATSSQSHLSPPIASREADESRLSRWFSLRKSMSIMSPPDGRSGAPLSRVSSVSEETEQDGAVAGSVSCSRSDTLRSWQLQQRISEQLQPLAEPPQLPQPPPAGLTQLQLRRRHVLQCIVDTENNYLTSLNSIITDYKHQLELCQPALLSAAKVATVFRHVADIVHCHTVFRIALADAVCRWDAEQRVGDVFVASFGKAAVLNVYSGYVNNFSAAMETVRQEAKRKSALADFLQQRQSQACDRLSLFGLMVKPVQRFPQLILQLQDLLKYTPRGHCDRMCLQLALTQLESLAEMLNERKRQSEQHQAFLDTVRRINGKFSSRSLGTGRGRHLLREDCVTRLHFAANGTISRSKTRRLYLLNDLLVCVGTSAPPPSPHPQQQQQQQRLTLKWTAPVCDVEVLESSASLTLSHVLTAGGAGHGGGGGGASDALSSVAQLCQQMTDLMHDYELVARISALMGSLRGQYQNFGVETAAGVAAAIQQEIRHKDEQIAWLDECSLRLAVRPAGSGGGGGRHSHITFQMKSPTSKQQWTTDLRLTQLALHENNNPAWNLPESDRVSSTATTLLFRSPLFVRAIEAQLPATSTTTTSSSSSSSGGGGGGDNGLQCRAATCCDVLASCYFCVPSSSLPSLASSSSMSTRHATADGKVAHYLWLCTVDSDAQCSGCVPSDGQNEHSTTSASPATTCTCCCWVTVYAVQQQVVFRECLRFAVNRLSVANSSRYRQHQHHHHHQQQQSAPVDNCFRVTSMCHIPSTGVCLAAGDAGVAGGYISSGAVAGDPGSAVWLSTAGGHILVYLVSDVMTSAATFTSSCSSAATAAAGGGGGGGETLESCVCPAAVRQLEQSVVALLPLACACVPATPLVYAGLGAATVAVLSPPCLHPHPRSNHHRHHKRQQQQQQQQQDHQFGPTTSLPLNENSGIGADHTPHLVHTVCLQHDHTSASGERSAAVRCLLLIGAHVYAGCGDHVFVIDVDTGQVLRGFAVQEHTPGAGHITCMAHSGVGLWLSLSHTSALCLYHIETFRHLQDVDVAAAVCRLLAPATSTAASGGGGGGGEEEAVRVTALSPYRGLLWVGTSAGVTLTVALPRLGGVPVVSGRGTLSYHAHRGPVRHVLQLAAPPAAPAATAASQLPPAPLACRHRACFDASAAVPEGGSALGPTGDCGVEEHTAHLPVCGAVSHTAAAAPPAAAAADQAVVASHQPKDSDVAVRADAAKSDGKFDSQVSQCCADTPVCQSDASVASAVDSSTLFTVTDTATDTATDTSTSTATDTATDSVTDNATSTATDTATDTATAVDSHLAALVGRRALSRVESTVSNTSSSTSASCCSSASSGSGAGGGSFSRQQAWRRSQTQSRHCFTLPRGFGGSAALSATGDGATGGAGALGGCAAVAGSCCSLVAPLDAGTVYDMYGALLAVRSNSDTDSVSSRDHLFLHHHHQQQQQHHPQQQQQQQLAVVAAESDEQAPPVVTTVRLARTVSTVSDTALPVVASAAATALTATTTAAAAAAAGGVVGGSVRESQSAPASRAPSFRCDQSAVTTASSAAPAQPVALPSQCSAAPASSELQQQQQQQRNTALTGGGSGVTVVAAHGYRYLHQSTAAHRPPTVSNCVTLHVWETRI